MATYVIVCLDVRDTAWLVGYCLKTVVLVEKRGGKLADFTRGLS